MKTKSTLLITMALSISLCFTSCNDDKKAITLQQLPPDAQNFIAAHFPNQATSYIMEDSDITTTEYNVQFTGGTEVEFDGNGNWTEIEFHSNIIPTSIILPAIVDYLTANYKAMKIDKLETRHYGYKVSLFNGPELAFDADGNFLRIDD